MFDFICLVWILLTDSTHEKEMNLGGRETAWLCVVPRIAMHKVTGVRQRVTQTQFNNSPIFD